MTLAVESGEIQRAISSLNKSCRIPCPACSPTRKKKSDRTMSVRLESDRAIYHCFHCDISGVVPFAVRQPRPVHTKKKPAVVVPISKVPANNQQIVIKALQSRAIDPAKVAHCQLIGGTKYFRDVGEVPAIGFVYGDQSAPSAIKWRTLDGKNFTQDGAAQTMYGIENLPEDCDTLVICEGEYDRLALEHCGIPALSVPSGAPQSVSKNYDPDNDRAFAFLADASPLIEGAKKIILMTDNDGPGQALSKEIMRRIDIAKCWTVEYPDGCKDANDVLKTHGEDALVDLVDSAIPVPLEGVYGATDYEDEFQDIYANGIGRGKSVGYPTVDNLFTLSPGQLIVVTGVPGSGKSEFVDQIMVNSARMHGWKWAVCSFENPVKYHMAKLAEKIVVKPFFSGFHQRMTQQDVTVAKQFLSNHFCFLEQKDDSPATIDSIINRTKQAVMRMGVRGLVIDPYNYVDMTNDRDEHLSISEMLTKVSRFAKRHGLVVIFVAHPTKLQETNGRFPVPTGQHISGSAAWFAKADIGFTVHRNAGAAEIYCWKVRFKWWGQQGKTSLTYNLPTGTYSEINDGSYRGMMNNIVGHQGQGVAINAQSNAQPAKQEQPQAQPKEKKNGSNDCPF